MKNTDNTRSFRGPLIEIVLIVGIFAIISIYILKIFMAADRLQGDAVNISKAVVHSESIAEYIKGCNAETIDDIAASCIKQFGNENTKLQNSDDSGLVIDLYFDGEWQECSEDYLFIIRIILTYDSEMANGKITVYRTTDEPSDECKIYSDIEVKRYMNN